MSLKQTAITAAKKAGAILKKYYGKKIPGVRSKGTSLVTDVDIWCNEAIIKEIRKKFPEHNIISEESKHKKTNSEYTWFVDPIDGTHNFIAGLPLFGTTVAVARGKEVVLGVIYLPVFDKLYVAEKGKGAFCNGKRIRVSKRKELDFSFLLFDSSSSTRKKKLKLMHSISSHLFNERVMGCAVCATAWVAEGSADAMIMFKTNSWDIAAGFLLIEEAGGTITNFKGEQWAPFQGNYVAGNHFMHRKVLKLLKTTL